MLTKMVFLHRGRFPPVWTLCEGLDTTVWWRGSIETAIGSTHRTAGPLTSTGGRYPLSSLVERPLLREKVIYNLWGSLLTLVDASLLWAQNVCVSCMLTFAHVGSFFLGGGGASGCWWSSVYWYSHSCTVGVNEWVTAITCCFLPTHEKRLEIWISVLWCPH